MLSIWSLARLLMSAETMHSSECCQDEHIRTCAGVVAARTHRILTRSSQSERAHFMSENRSFWAFCTATCCRMAASNVCVGVLHGRNAASLNSHAVCDARRRGNGQAQRACQMVRWVTLACSPHRASLSEFSKQAGIKHRVSVRVGATQEFQARRSITSFSNRISCATSIAL